ncbi:aldehyde dehydrogenase [Xylariales sp. PMI_506]|nr:aldehyde dehydrogenase [Xylariales sp. PMI_506]
MAFGKSDEYKLNFTTFHNVINGELKATTQTHHTLNPSTLEHNPEAPLSIADDVEKAVKAAKNAAKLWVQEPWDVRKKALEGFIEALESLSEDFAQMLVWEQGKPPLWARHEVATAISFLRGFCALSLKEELVPALLTGNVFILKPSPFTPYSSLKLAELGMRFFPPGVFQALSGDDILGPILTAHPRIDMVSFTGSSSTGKQVMKACSEMLTRVTLELGGNDAAIICAHVDPAVAAAKVGTLSFVNSGQMCMVIKRAYVHEAIYDEFLAAMVEHVKSWKLGVDEVSFIGPLVKKIHFQRINNMIADIKETGLKIASEAVEASNENKGFYVPCTIIDNPPDSATIVQLEQFGPILPVLKWCEEDDVVHRINDSETGLGASIWTRNDAQALRLQKQLDTGNVWINTHAEIVQHTPFGGHKQSGLGVEWDVDGLKAYRNTKALYTRAF